MFSKNRAGIYCVMAFCSLVFFLSTNLLTLLVLLLCFLNTLPFPFSLDSFFLLLLFCFLNPLPFSLFLNSFFFLSLSLLSSHFCLPFLSFLFFLFILQLQLPSVLLLYSFPLKFQSFFFQLTFILFLFCNTLRSLSSLKCFNLYVPLP